MLFVREMLFKTVSGPSEVSELIEAEFQASRRHKRCNPEISHRDYHITA